jgi:uncharacterized protein
MLVGFLVVLALVMMSATSRSVVAGSNTRLNGSHLGARLLTPKSASTCQSDGDPMYHADAIVTGTDMRQRPWGFAQCLREVLVKVSADPSLANDPRTAELARHADRFVASYNYLDLMAGDPLHDEQGTYDRPYKLTVYFDPARIDAALAKLGDRPWHGDRPVIVPVLRVAGPNPPPYVLSAEIPAGAEQRGSFALAANEFGMTVRFPGKAELAAWGVSAEHFPSPTAEPPASRTPGEMVVVGTLQWSETLPGWIGQWHTAWHGAAYAWGVKGVNYDAAFRDIVTGSVLLATGRGPPH